ERVNTLIPILVRTGRTFTEHDRALGYMRPDLIFWYDPTPELLALLPDSLRAQLSMELAEADSAIHKVEISMLSNDSVGVELPEISAPPKISVPPTNVTPDTNQAKYFDLWRATSGAIISSLIYPNPTSGEFALQYTLTDARTVTATLHDITGHEIQVLGRQSSAAGISTINARVQSVAPGIYLIALTTDKGEQAVQRVIIER
ncbi:MAG TPA: T9SS type A sorting domain-containing protein, partial [Candidatus Kapabacteria bacterium]|nr:T9SS type A sorting domain-containing protein [Candidatus Kapabacteria bacterium]